jgi:hypothetical protein
MAKKHGKDTVIKLNSVDLSAFCNTSEFTRTADSHDTTTYGADAHGYDGGLTDAKATIGGMYDDSATGPRATIEPLIGTKVPYIRQPEGAGSGLAQDSCTVLVVSYVESSPVADMVTWSAELQVSGDVDSTDQSA